MFNCLKFLFLGNVAFISGGSNLASTEIYSPNGLCSLSLAPMPLVNDGHFLFLRNKNIISCGGSGTYDCFIYYTTNNTWAPYITAQWAFPPFSVYNNQLFYSGYGNVAQLLDLSTKVWSTWPLAPTNTYGGCQVTWRDAFIRFGGFDKANWALKFNHTTQNWTTLAVDMPMNIYLSGCTLMADDKLLVVGSSKAPGEKTTVYDLNTNQWISNGTFDSTMYILYVVNYGTRYFAHFALRNVATNIVQEFHPSNNSFTNVAFPLKVDRTGSPAVVSVPAKLFRNILPTCSGVS